MTNGQFVLEQIIYKICCFELQALHKSTFQTVLSLSKRQLATTNCKLCFILLAKDLLLPSHLKNCWK